MSVVVLAGHADTVGLRTTSNIRDHVGTTRIGESVFKIWNAYLLLKFPPSERALFMLILICNIASQWPGKNPIANASGPQDRNIFQRNEIINSQEGQPLTNIRNSERFPPIETRKLVRAPNQFPPFQNRNVFEYPTYRRNGMKSGFFILFRIWIHP